MTGDTQWMTRPPVKLSGDDNLGLMVKESMSRGY